MFVKKKDRKKKKIGKNSHCWEYALNNKKIGIAVSLLDGRYPDKGSAVNAACAEIYYVLRGTGRVFMDNKSYKLHEGDALLIEAGKKYHVIAKKMLLLAPTAPAWFAGQHKIV
jgi:mannose-6-phosphate isomerase-like protein (cupin superfamily)